MMPPSEPWVAHWNLHRDPFCKDIDASELWLPDSRLQAVDSLAQAVRAKTCALLVGEPGVGKTCTLRALRQRLPDTSFRLTYCHNATVGRRDFYRQICQTMGLSPRATASGVFQQVSAHIVELGQEQVHPVLVLDEAHLLQQEVLDHLHILLNFSWDQRPLLSVVLVGLPELHDQLELRRNRSLHSRLGTRLCLGPLQGEDTELYLAHRLLRAGVGRPIFESSAVTLIHEATGGLLRGIDRLARASLQATASAQAEEVTAAHVQNVLSAESRRA